MSILDFAVESKTGDVRISPAIGYFAERTDIPRFYQIHRMTDHYSRGNVTVLPCPAFCQEEIMP